MPKHRTTSDHEPGFEVVEDGEEFLAGEFVRCDGCGDTCRRERIDCLCLDPRERGDDLRFGECCGVSTELLRGIESVDACGEKAEGEQRAL
jgi:hypothetical protein